MPTDYFVGLDLWQTTDFTALAVLERSDLVGAPEYAVRHLHRFSLGTAYTHIVPAVARLTSAAPIAGQCTLVVDQTGVGRPLVEMLRKEPGMPFVVPITITGGQQVRKSEDGLHVPKKELVTALQRLLQERRLRVAAGLPDASILQRELTTFLVRITASAQETFGGRRGGSHDDLVLAVALGAWYAEQTPYSRPGATVR